MKIKAKLRRIGNSLGVLLPKEVITDYKEGEEIELEVITAMAKTDVPVITPLREPRRKLEWCEKHDVWKSSCGCQ